MSLLHVDGFAHYGDKTNLGLVYVVNTNGNGPSIPMNDPAIFERSYVRVTQFGRFTYNLTAPKTRLFVGFRFRLSAFAANNASLMFMTAENTGASAAVRFWVNTAGGININVNGGFLSPSVQASTSGGLLTPNIWYYMEAAFNTITKIVDLYIDGNLVLSYNWAGSIADIATISPCRFYANSVGQLGYVTDFYICDDIGAAPQNGLLGEIAALTIFPDADLAPQDWTKSSGANAYALLDDFLPTDVNFVSATTAGQIDRFGLQNLPITVGAVYGAQIYARAKKDIAGSGEFFTTLIAPLGGTASSISFTPSISAGYFKSSVIQNNPDGGLFTRNIINNCTVAIQRSV